MPHSVACRIVASANAAALAERGAGTVRVERRRQRTDLMHKIMKNGKHTRHNMEKCSKSEEGELGKGGVIGEDILAYMDLNVMLWY